MFTGIIEGRGRIAALRRRGNDATVRVACTLDLTETQIGDSIAINGVCLTVVSLDAHAFTADISHETLARTTLGQLLVGGEINLERALRVGDRLGGHMVQGHVDGTGRVKAIVPSGDATDWHFECPLELMDEIVEKGSICVDGISLTVNGVTESGFQVTIIPHTAEVTSLGAKRVGDAVNLETDIVGKYIVSLARRGRLAGAGLSLDKLKEHGFA